MVYENGAPVTYYLRERYEYNINDSLTKLYKASSSYQGYSSGLSIKEVHTFKNGFKVQSKIYRLKDPDIVTYSFKTRDTIYRTTKKSDYNRPYYEQLVFNKGKLIKISEVDKQRSNSKGVSYSYNTSGQITEIKTEYIQRNSATNYVYE